MAVVGTGKRAVGSGVGQRAADRRPAPPPASWPVLAAISLGGALGAVARYGLGQVVPAAPGGFPWATFVVNVSGCLLIGVLMVLVTEVRTGRPLVRPFLGVGVLGGFTTFSSFVVEVQRLVAHHETGLALGYLAVTVVVALAATAVGTVTTRRAVARLAGSRQRPAAPTGPRPEVAPASPRPEVAPASHRRRSP